MRAGRGSLETVTMATAFLQDGVGYEDMAKLQDLHEGSILDNIKQRYEKDRIYVSI